MADKTQTKKGRSAPPGATGPDRAKDRQALKRDAQVATEVRELADPVCRSEGMELVHVEYQREAGGKILRLYIDRQGGVSLDDCAHISRQLSDVLDVNLETDEFYRLEVSSPGTDRPLGREADFERFKGETAKIKVAFPIEGQKNFTGVLLGLHQGNVKLLNRGREVSIPLDSVIKARLVNYNGENRC